MIARMGGALLAAVAVVVFPTTTTAWTTTFVKSSFASATPFATPRWQTSPLTMDVESPDHFPRKLQVKLTEPITTTLQIPRTATSTHGMPWKKSICPDYREDELQYMPFWEWQMEFMASHLTNLQALPVKSKAGTDMSYVENEASTMRMHTSCFSSDEYKRIRLTVLDAGHQTQVFTSLWYPKNKKLPVLGIDLLQFNHGKKHLCIVDFQPLDNGKHDAPYEHLLAPIRDQYPSLQGVMTERFYSKEDSFFSNQMLLGRHNGGKDDESYTAKEMVFRDLFPAFAQYVAAHTTMVQECPTNAVLDIESLHAAYDTYSAERDPAHALLARAFGPEWANDYVYDVLFPLSERPNSESV